MGRPSDYNDEIAATICQRIACGETLKQVCSDEGMPDRSTVVRWTYANEAFRAAYARARADLVEFWADEIVEISDDGTNDVYEDSEGRERTDQDVIQRSRLRVDSRKWLMAKLQPRKYGDALKVEATGADGAPLVPASFRVEFVKPEEDSQ